MKYKITEDSFIQIAMNNYDNTQCISVDEFNQDINRFMHLSKLFNRYQIEADLKERLILNHIIIIYNCFGSCATDLLFFKIEQEHWSYLITFMMFLNRIPEDSIYHGVNITGIKLDKTIIERLNSL